MPGHSPAAPPTTRRSTHRRRRRRFAVATTRPGEPAGGYSRSRRFRLRFGPRAAQAGEIARPGGYASPPVEARLCYRAVSGPVRPSDEVPSAYEKGVGMRRTTLAGLVLATL